ncbi:FecCD family ABC transporter permease [Paenarthrobacter nicotinovorans]|uniref:FecCD family ABC transporter permease n=1 Tax=Paenarthrobacter nicotinovorans TaxID=29320 RepID=UPI002486974F|nr:iron chelate uptake ABC transporter family permease subunit [Paenarthrobacter nicotinovorans]MDI2022176.1 Ferric enterobactin transport system permease protein FepG [Paenarthrobacter nicotinovorans]
MSRLDPVKRVDFGRPVAVVRNRSLSLRLDIRSMLVCIPLLLAALAVAVVSLATGDYEVSVQQVLQAFTGDAPGLAQAIVMEWRLPRVLAALVFGAALGMSGGIFQSMTRNPLGSPDIIGFNTGAYTGALIVMLTVGGSYAGVAAGALVGGVLTALAVYLLAYRRGSQGFRLIIVGIGISAMLAALNHWLILQAELDAAPAAAVWGARSLNGITWEQAAPVS